jgi:type II secretory ATPase GspE/PulE/Tfp pilus assembly ATPase PilB-like protein
LKSQALAAGRCESLKDGLMKGKPTTDSATTSDMSTGWRSELPAQVGAMLSEALAFNATDIHVDPVDLDTYRVCYRVDGVIQPKTEISKDEGLHLINQIKVAAGITTIEEVQDLHFPGNTG